MAIRPGRNTTSVEAARRQTALLEALAAIPEPPEAQPSAIADAAAHAKFVDTYRDWFARFEAVRPGERITIDGDAWRCLCGNENHLDGFDPVTRAGQPAGGSEPWQSPFWGCRQCGRIIRASDGFVLCSTGSQPVQSLPADVRDEEKGGA